MISRRHGDTICEHCGHEYFWDEHRTCWKCNRPVCPECMNASGNTCPECSVSDIPRHLEPMLATLSETPPKGNWGIEFKWDGVRALTYLDGARLVIESRLLSNITSRYPEVYRLGQILDGRSAVFDGEIVALDSGGRPDFHRLQQRMHLCIEQVPVVMPRVPVQYYLFDIIYLDGESLSGRPYVERREILQSLPLENEYIKIPPYRIIDPEPMIEVARMHGLEGIVCKRLDSTYKSGIRTKDWIKVKIVSSENFVIGGWTREKNNSDRVGALLIGYYVPDKPGLVYAGKVGTGFNDADHRMLTVKLKELKRDITPFTTPVPDKNAEFILPRLVVEVAYQRWNPDGLLQIASYKGLRNDTPASQVQFRR